MQNKVLIANRGEIAIRIIRALKELGIGQVAVYSKADADSLHVKLADEAICIGEAPSADSYLNMTNLISAAISTGCNAIHPGYGFLAENEKFAEMVEKCNIKFIGPSSEVIHQLGNKIEAKRLAREAGIPVVEGSDGVVENLETAIKVAKRVTYPILIKARNGGGGKGISIIKNENELIKMFELTRQEAKANFGDSGVYIEKYIENPHHIEVQIIADSFGNIVHLGERDCSVQRRNQKVIEESPSPYVDDELRAKLGDAAVRLAKSVGYENAGTVEFLVDKDKKFYFIEMNTRIQVEHPVTEMVTGIDIVKEQIRVAYNSGLSFSQKDVVISGHSIECRLNAEDPYNNFRPSPGVVKNLVVPGGPGVRVDTHIYNNYMVPPYYDSMLAKLIVHAPTRKEAIRKMRVALEQFLIDGIMTNIEILYLIMHNTHFVRGIYDTNFVSEFLESIKDKFNE
ncbi:MAG TPA: acetyl-CoA carboxylase biotin carboxylase subunit [Acholeplasmataceae bacterium]|nr:acetyl-CoA carboxylase biotin carboxylase subunit [Acholeplasmataceae bacterium]